MPFARVFIHDVARARFLLLYRHRNRARARTGVVGVHASHVASSAQRAPKGKATAAAVLFWVRCCARVGDVDRCVLRKEILLIVIVVFGHER